MAQISAISAIAAGAGTVLSAYQSYQQGAQEKENAYFEAAQLKRNALKVEAAAQRTAIRHKRDAAYVKSDALSKAAASGAGSSDPTALDIMNQIEAEGEYNALLALYGGDQDASAMRLQAEVRKTEGKNAKKAGMINAFTTVLSSVGSGAFGKPTTGGSGVPPPITMPSNIQRKPYK